MNITLTTIKSALVSGFLMAFIIMGGYVISLGNIFAVDWRIMANLGIISLLTSLVSVAKNALTNDNGSFVGAIKVADPASNG